jgi:hypothetical protein
MLLTDAELSRSWIKAAPLPGTAAASSRTAANWSCDRNTRLG